MSSLHSFTHTHTLSLPGPQSPRLLGEGALVPRRASLEEGDLGPDLVDVGRISRSPQGREKPLLLPLHVGLVEAPDPVPDGAEVEMIRIEEVAAVPCGRDDGCGEGVVEPLLLGGVVPSRVLEVLPAAGNEDRLELRRREGGLERGAGSGSGGGERGGRGQRRRRRRERRIRKEPYVPRGNPSSRSACG